jgi:hypothetical protein
MADWIPTELATIGATREVERHEGRVEAGDAEAAKATTIRVVPR